MTTFSVPSRSGAPAEVWAGQLVARESTRTDGRPRWVDFAVYLLDDSTWLAHRAGMSVIYHMNGTSCRTANNRKPGALATVDDLPDDAEPCPGCQPPPPLDLGDSEKIRFEFPRHTISRAPTPAGLFEELVSSRQPGTGLRVRKMSGPVESLLEQLAARFPQWATIEPPAGTVNGPLTGRR